VKDFGTFDAYPVLTCCPLQSGAQNYYITGSG